MAHDMREERRPPEEKVVTIGRKFTGQMTGERKREEPI